MLAPYALADRPNPWAAVLLGFVAGAALQLQQAALWPWPDYAVFTLVALVLTGFVARKSIAPRVQFALLLGAAVLLGVGATGWRASAYQSGALNPALEGHDLRVTGIVAAMPQRTESGLRLRLAVESATTTDGRPVALPDLVDVSWYGGAFAVAAMPTADFSKWVQPASIAAVIAFLASDAASDISGAAIPVYGRS